jgi:hypothetical protein
VLADLDALPCDSTTSTRAISEPRWTISARRSQVAGAYHTDVTLRTLTGDSVSLHRAGGCE